MDVTSQKCVDDIETAHKTFSMHHHHQHYNNSGNNECDHHRREYRLYPLMQGWATYSPRAIIVRPARPPEGKIIWMNIMCTFAIELWVRPATKITTLFLARGGKKPTTALMHNHYYTGCILPT